MHALQNTAPQPRQWCRRSMMPKSRWHCPHLSAIASGAQRGRSTQSLEEQSAAAMVVATEASESRCGAENSRLSTRVAEPRRWFDARSWKAALASGLSKHQRHTRTGSRYPT